MSSQCKMYNFLDHCTRINFCFNERETITFDYLAHGKSSTKYTQFRKTAFSFSIETRYQKLYLLKSTKIITV